MRESSANDDVSDLIQSNWVIRRLLAGLGGVGLTGPGDRGISGSCVRGLDGGYLFLDRLQDWTTNAQRMTRDLSGKMPPRGIEVLVAYPALSAEGFKIRNRRKMPKTLVSPRNSRRFFENEFRFPGVACLVSWP